MCWTGIKVKVSALSKLSSSRSVLRARVGVRSTPWSAVVAAAAKVAAAVGAATVLQVGRVVHESRECGAVPSLLAAAAKRRDRAASSQLLTTIVRRRRLRMTHALLVVCSGGRPFIWQ